MATFLLAMVISFMLIYPNFFEIGSKRYTDLGNGWHRINLGRFEIETPNDFNYVKAQGIDSFVGYITNFDDTIEFDFGLYSNPFSGDEWQNQQENINGINAIIATAKGNETGVHFPSLHKRGEKLSLFSETENKKLIRKIYRTVIFTQ